MSQINGKTVTIAAMKESMFIPGIGDVRKELSSTANATDKAVSMVIEEPFLLLSIDDSKSRRKLSVAVPLDNVKYLVFASETVTIPPLK